MQIHAWKKKLSIYGDEFCRMAWSMSIISRLSLVSSKILKIFLNPKHYNINIKPSLKSKVRNRLLFPTQTCPFHLPLFWVPGKFISQQCLDFFLILLQFKRIIRGMLQSHHELNCEDTQNDSVIKRYI